MSGDHEIDVRFSDSEISARIEILAREVAARLPADTLVVAVLKGSFVFAADLIRALSRVGTDWPMDFITLSSYGTGTESSGMVRIVRDLTDDVAGRDVLIIDDILESGRTLAFARDLLLQRGANRVWICTLLDKRGKRRAPIEADFIGFEVPDEFVVGYGLDWAHRYRGLPYIGVVRR
jgi:hypoxanthine phosphoribosyltransferase